MNELALFAGAGGGILGGHLLGWRCVCAVEIEDYPRRVLLARQRDGCLPRFPIWDDITTFDGRPWRGRVDVVSGGFPCQDISSAGKGKGLDGERSGLWAEMARVIGEVQPKHVLVENSPMLTLRGLGRVLGDLASLGYDARWGVLGADAVGACHHRARLWVVANAVEIRLLHSNNETRNPQQESLNSIICRVYKSLVSDEDLPEDIRNYYEVAGWVDRFKAIGNGQVPAVVRLAWETLSEGDEQWAVTR